MNSQVALHFAAPNPFPCVACRALLSILIQLNPNPQRKNARQQAERIQARYRPPTPARAPPPARRFQPVCRRPQPARRLHPAAPSPPPSASNPSGRSPTLCAGHGEREKYRDGKKARTPLSLSPSRPREAIAGGGGASRKSRVVA